MQCSCGELYQMRVVRREAEGWGDKRQGVWSRDLASVLDLAEECQVHLET